MSKQPFNANINGYSKVNQFADETLIPKIELSDFMNGVLDKDGGQCVKRDGIVQINPSTPAPDNALYDLHEFVPSNGKDYVVAKNDQKIIRSENGLKSWENLADVTANRVNYANYINNLFVTSETDLIEIQDLDSGKVFDLQVAPPDDSKFDFFLGIAEDPEADGGVLELDAVYYWTMVYKLKNGSFSLPSRTRTVYSDDDGAVDLGKLLTTRTLTIDPANINTAIINNNSGSNIIEDSRVQSLLLYRSQASNPNVFYLTEILEDINEENLSWTIDRKPDAALDLTDRIRPIDEILGAKYPLMHKNRLFLGNVSKKNNYPFMMPVNVGPVGSEPTDPNLGVIPILLYQHFSIQSGNFTITPSPGTIGLEPEGNYKYKLLVNDPSGIISKTFDFEVTLLATSNASLIQNIDWKVYLGQLNSKVSYQLYRTKADGSVYYLLANPAKTIVTLDDGVNNQFIDLIPDEDLVTQLDDSGITDTSLLVYSEQDKPNEIRTINSIPVTPDELNPITGMVELNEGILIFKANSIERLITQGLPSQNWTLGNISNQLGCDMPDSIVKSGLGVYFMKKNQIYRYPDRLFEPVSLFRKDDIDLINIIYSGSYISSKNWVVFAFGDGLLVYDEKIDCWYIFGEKPDQRGYGYNYATLYGRRL